MTGREARRKEKKRKEKKEKVREGERRQLFLTFVLSYISTLNGRLSTL